MNMKVKIGGVELKNPVMTASGTFGSGAEYSEFVDLNQAGSSGNQRGGRCSLAGQSHTPYRGNPQRDDERYRSPESGS